MRQAFTLILLSTLTSYGEPSDSVVEKTPATPPGMVYIPGGLYQRGNDRPLPNANTFPEEQPVHAVTVSAFFMDETEVTNRDFKTFADATGYKTIAETGFSTKDFPQAPPGQLTAGAIIFTTPDKDINPNRASLWQWWQFTPGASWRTFATEDRLNHPVTCITYEDASAYAKWAGKRLPTEAEWERAARGGLKGKLYTWGDEEKPDGKWRANAFQGDFPSQNSLEDGFAGTAPVKSFPANGYGLYDMAGNVWEICSDYYSPRCYEDTVKDQSHKPSAISQMELNYFLNTGKLIPEEKRSLLPFTALYLIRGGSFLCDADYCMRYRPAARFYTESISPTNHIGFRCVKDLEVKQ